MSIFQDFLELLSTREFIILVISLVTVHLIFLSIKEYMNYRNAKRYQKSMEDSLRQSEESIRTIYDEIEQKRQRLLDQIEQNPEINISQDEDEIDPDDIDDDNLNDNLEPSK